jgi:hypothetical protein
MHAAALDLGQKKFELAVANEGVASDEGDVEWLVVVDDGEHFCDQLLSFEVGELTEFGLASEVGRVEGIATGAAERAFFGDFNRERGDTTGKDTSPRIEDFGLFH